MLEMMFGSLLSVTLATSAVIAVLLLASALLGRRYGATWKVWIWLALAVRLLIPLNITLPVPPVEISAPSRVIVTGAPQEATELGGQAAAPTQPLPDATMPPRQTAKSTSFTPLELAAQLWIVGAVLTAAAQLAGGWRFFREVSRWAVPASESAQAVLLETAHRIGLAEEQLPALRICPAIPGPMMTGMLHPVILLPRETIDEPTLSFILQHELTHLRRHDIAAKLLLAGAVTLHWFNPLVWLMGREAGRDIELACDQEVVMGQNADFRARYGETILAAVRERSRRAPILSTCFDAGENGVRRRLTELFDVAPKRRGAAALAAIFLAVCLAGACIYVRQGQRVNTLLPAALPEITQTEIGGQLSAYDFRVGDEIQSMEIYLESWQNGAAQRRAGICSDLTQQKAGTVVLSQKLENNQLTCIISRQENGKSVSTLTTKIELPLESKGSLTERLFDQTPAPTIRIVPEQPIVLSATSFTSSGSIRTLDANNPDMLRQAEYVCLVKAVFHTRTAEEVAAQRPGLSEELLRDRLEGAAALPVVSFASADYDSDGDREAFALVGQATGQPGAAVGELWFVSSDSKPIRLTDESHWDHARAVGAGAGAWFVAEELGGGTSSSSRIFELRNGQPNDLEPTHSLMRFEETEKGRYSALHSTYDGFDDGTGHTWKPYWFYWDDGLREYGGIEMTPEQLTGFEGGQAALDAIAAEQGVVKSLYYRANGIVNINYQTALGLNAHQTLALEQNRLLDRSEQAPSGLYLPALLAEIAVYPERIPASNG